LKRGGKHALNAVSYKEAVILYLDLGGMKGGLKEKGTLDVKALLGKGYFESQPKIVLLKRRWDRWGEGGGS